MIECTEVKKALKRVLIVVVVMLVVIAALLPAVVPPVVERLVTQKLAAFGLPGYVRMHLGWCWRNGLGLAGGIRVALADTPWCVRADFAGSCCEWTASVKMNETEFNESDPALAELLKRYPITAVSNLTFSGSIALNASVVRTFRKPVAVWNIRLPIRNLMARATVEENSYAIEGLSVTLAASGIDDHIDIAPMFLRIRSIDANGFPLGNLSASIRATEKALLVTEASAALCGGKVVFYSLFLDPATFNTGFTLFVDEVDAGEVLSHFKGFRGEASGKLHGKIKLFIREGGKALRLSDAFLYSTPGEVGKLRMEDASPVTDNLALAGLDDATRANVANALTDLDYSVLKLNLRRTDRESATLSVNLNGTATRGKTSVPVNLTLNFNGELEQIINTGLRISEQTKGN